MDKPIPFTGPMVAAILDGRKTQTRRVLKQQPHLHNVWQDEDSGEWFQSGPGEYGDDFLNVPYAGGDRLWVKEAWRPDAADATRAVHRADVPDDALIDLKAAGIRWRSSRFMPRWASRLTLIVTDVRVQRVQDISEEDAEAEGAQCERPGLLYKSHRVAFNDLWDSINAKPKPRYAVVYGRKVITHYESFPWGGESRTEAYRGKPHHIVANPWVAAVTFDVIRGNIDEVPQ